jgi:hypothetical protein
MKLPKNDKSLTWGIFALVTLVVAYWFGSRTGKGRGFSDLVNKEITGNQLTYEPSQYLSFAERLEQAMYGLTDNENAVYAVFAKMRNKSDVLQLIKAFAERRMFLTIGKSDLGTWINYRLSNSEIEHINEILSRNNIDYSF